MKSELEKLIDLQKTDTNIRRLKKSIETAEERRAEVEQEFEKHASSIREIQTTRDDAAALRADLERQIAEAKTSLERANRNLKTAQDQKQYEAAMRETDILQKGISKLETQVLEKMTEIEETDKVLEERAEEINSLESNKNAAIRDFETELAANKREYEAETNIRSTRFADVSPRFASVYNRLAQRSRDGIAVAEVVNGSCSACFMTLRPQMQVELKTSDQVMTCESCSRILYTNHESKAANQES